MGRKEYFGDLIGGSLLIVESRIIADLLLKKMSNDEWYELVFVQNILQKKSAKTSSRNVKTIKSRLEGLGNEFIELLLLASDRMYIQLLMLALMIHSPVVADFMRLSLAESRRTYKPTLADNAWLEFYDLKVQAYPELGEFANSTIKKMGSNTIKALVDSGYLSDSRYRQIQPVYLLPEVKEWMLSQGKENLIEVMECTL